MVAPPTVVIVGGSFGGLGVAQALLKDVPAVRVVLVSPSRTAFFNIASPRIFADPGAFPPEKYLFKIEDSFKKYGSSAFELIEGRVSAIDPAGKVVTIEESGKLLPYDYLLIASGSTTASALGRESAVVPFKSPNTGDIELLVKKAQEEIAGAETILVAGGGPVGVEFAGELAQAFRGKPRGKITLISLSSRLLPMLKEAASTKAKDLLQKNHVSVRTGRKVLRAEQDSSTKKWRVVLDDDQVITCDMFISTTGVLPNSSFIPTEYLTEDGWVKVDTEFRVKGGNGNPDRYMYAIGDITAYPERLSTKVHEQIPIVASNIKADVLGLGPRSRYTPKGSVTMLVPVGGSGGTGQLFGLVPWNWLVAKTKGKDYFIGQAARFLGLE